MKMLHMAAFLLLVVGGVNWLLVAFGFNLVEMVFGGMESPLTKLVYILVGVSAIYIMLTHKKDCKICGGK